MTMQIKQHLNATHTHNSFVGAMPVNLSRRSCSLCRRKSTLLQRRLTVRYLLYVVPEPASGHPMAVLMDRKGALFSIKGTKALGGAWVLTPCWMVSLCTTAACRKWCSCSFDVLLLDNKEQVTLPFERRYHAIETTIMARYKAFFDDTSKGVPGEDQAVATLSFGRFSTLENN